jgi:hypothetical protein
MTCSILASFLYLYKMQYVLLLSGVSNTSFGGEIKSWGASGAHHDFFMLLGGGGEAQRRAGHGGGVAAAFLPALGKKRAS